jgi:rfaE bifunctional protein nucleotidyltransferase chain/domain
LNNKVISCSELKALGECLRRRQLKISLANGCFDLLHVGHIRYLQEAKRQGDVLVVGVNSDRAVAGLKGPGRPLMDEAARTELIAAIECVDYVVVFDALSAEDVLRELRPHVHCKGTDYSERTVPEQAVVESIGATVRIVGDPKSHSTREIIADIQQRFGEPGTPAARAEGRGFNPAVR